ncbi:MAG: hypothetical protein ACRD22_18710 [Terriglobia bacterium]
MPKSSSNPWVAGDKQTTYPSERRQDQECPGEPRLDGVEPYGRQKPVDQQGQQKCDDGEPFPPLAKEQQSNRGNENGYPTNKCGRTKQKYDWNRAVEVEMDRIWLGGWLQAPCNKGRNCT